MGRYNPGMIGILVCVCVVGLIAAGIYFFHARGDSAEQAIRPEGLVEGLPRIAIAAPLEHIDALGAEVSDEYFESVVHEAHGDRIQKAFYSKISGASYLNDDGTSRREAIELCSPLDVLTPVHEADNPYDPNAIAIYSPHGVQIGYVEKRAAGEIIRASTREELVWKFVFRRATINAETFKTLGCVLYIVRMSPENIAMSEGVTH